ncbi:Small ribosomal subunit protein mS38 [Madurella fahalii]|uniref:Small ribosomal subunit protein mS38 n=1 Tax=Madurella fahalii TaxID=1157608 RepID=A0ABQ0FYK1_9PEZI
MLNSSVRRVVAAAAPQSPAASSVASAVPRAAVAYSLPYRPAGVHQRRYSSSKPSSPDDGSRDYTSRPSVPAEESKTTGEKRKRKAKEPVPQLPSVPSTRHIKNEALALSTFFALHRPISVTQLLPKTVSEDAFAEIFAQSRRHKMADVISTLSQTVHTLDEPLSKMNDGRQEVQDAEDGTVKLNLKHQDGTETNVYLQLDSMSGHFLPFTPPPAPEPLAETDAESANNAMAEEATEREPQTRIYKAMVTIEETIDGNGQYKVEAHSPELVEDVEPQPRSFLERLAQRQLRYDEARRQQGRTMQAISVRRQRKLRMKKKKYKKLMRKTRNIRRKLDRL